MQNRKIEIYTDGSCLGNPGPGGWAALIIIDDKETAISGNETDSTNNRMEMTAIIKALEWLRKEFPSELKDLTINIYSDSNLIIQTLKLGWKRKANTDLWAEMDKLRAWLNINWNWVKGHHTNKHNNFVDQLAVRKAKEISN